MVIQWLSIFVRECCYLRILLSFISHGLYDDTYKVLRNLCSYFIHKAMQILGYPTTYLCTNSMNLYCGSRLETKINEYERFA